MKPDVVLGGLILIAFAGCDQGLEPGSSAKGPGAVSGLITYQNWPPQDSLLDLRIVAFREFPPVDVVRSVLSGSAIVYPPLGDTALVPFYADSLRFEFGLPSGTYQYVAVVQQFGANVFSDWRPVGQYDLDSDLSVPTPVVVPPGDTLRNLNIRVDFADPPPAPF